MDLGLRYKNVLITGGSKGIGLACARAFLAEGARVAIVSRTQTHLDDARRALGEVFVMAVDLCDASAATLMVERVEAEFGAIDILVNSAGAAQMSAVDDLSPSAWHAAMEAKYFTAVHVIDPMIKRMSERGTGAIINIIGTGGKFPTPSHLPGGAANAALMLVTAGLANTYAAKGVSVVGLSPGATNTERVALGVKAQARRLGLSEEQALDSMKRDLPLGRFAEPEEIADLVVFAASERGRYLTGANIVVNGAATPSVV
ncbi:MULTISPECIES: SDR family oxidoreductase [Pseudomonas]|uniref:SDR family oxidoreductase n=1 Tax=Pseudomonas TaxID=286 RepID=UPI00071FAB7E|nr:MULTISPECIES: SDR family oxidoreductase [Pseudomonas]ALQ02578.1 3-oxoacyl-[acyl-carrier protein] reductase [Pseudomonas brassicacearum]